MARKIDSSIIDDAARIVRDGNTIKFAAEQVGVSYPVLCSKLKNMGVKSCKRSGNNRIDIPVDEIKSMYESGESENAISKHLGISRAVIRKGIIRAGITPRTQSEAEKLKWSKMSNEARSNQVKYAHDACRGKPRSFSAKCALASARQKIKYDFLIGLGEIEFSELLSDRGFDFIAQKAVDTYNVDFAIGNIAVELTADMGRYRRNNIKENDRVKYLTKRGYSVLAIELDSVRTLVNCSDYIISTINEMRSLKPIDSQYRVIRCRLKDYTIVKDKLGKFSSIPSPEQFLASTHMVKIG